MLICMLFWAVAMAGNVPADVTRQSDYVSEGNRALDDGNPRESSGVIGERGRSPEIAGVQETPDGMRFVTSTTGGDGAAIGWKSFRIAHIIRASRWSSRS